MMYPIKFNMISVFPVWLEKRHTTRSASWYGLSASIGATKYGALILRHGPASALASGDSHRRDSAHSDTSKRGGGRHDSR